MRHGLPDERVEFRHAAAILGFHFEVSQTNLPDLRLESSVKFDLVNETGNLRNAIPSHREPDLQALLVLISSSLLQLRVFRVGLLEDGDAGIGVFPKC